MAAIPTRTFARLTEGFAAGVQGRARALVDFSRGSVLLAVGEATSDLLLWLQSIVVYVLTLTRAGTSKGADLDTWLADFGVERLPARAATGTLTFARLSAATSTLVVPVDGLVQTADGSRQVRVYASPSHGAYSAADGGYLIQPGASQVEAVPVQALTPGVAGNVSRGTLNQIASAMPGVDTVTNPSAFTDGQEAETDPAVRLRFRAFLASLFKATRAALAYAITSLQQGLSATFLEHREPNGRRNPAFNSIFVDDGSGAPSSTLVARAAAAVEANRAFGVRIGVFGASRLPAHVQMTVIVAAGFQQPTVVAAVEAALAVYLNGLGEGSLPYTRLENVAYGASPGVANVTAVSLNGGMADLVPVPGQRIKAGNIVVTPGV